MPLSVSTKCPSCGGELEFEHGSNAVSCRFCGSSHVVTGHGRALSYFIPEKISLKMAAGLALAKLNEKGGGWKLKEATLFFVPFHHFKGQDLYWEVEEKVVSEGDTGGGFTFRISSFSGMSFGGFMDGFDGVTGRGSMPLTEKRFELDTRHIDRTLPALDVPELKVFSLGLRPEVLKLSLFRKDAVLKRGQLSPVRVDGRDVEERGYAPRQSESVVARRVIGKTRSVIHFPFWVIEAVKGAGPEGAIAVVDGVSGDITNLNAPASMLDRLIDKDGDHYEVIGLRPLKCPDCGADLPVRPKDVVFFCAGCGKAWYINGTELIQVSYSVMPPKNGAAVSEYMPFWVVEARVVSGTESIGNKYELTKLAPGVRVPTEEDKKIPLRFFVPAFEIGNLKILSRFASSFTNSQPVWQDAGTQDSVTRITPSRGCFISPEDALELAPLTLFSLIPKGNKRALKFAQEAKVEVKEAVLALVPFTKSRTDYVDGIFGIAMPAAALRD